MSNPLNKQRMTELEAYNAWKKEIWEKHASIYLKDLYYYGTQRDTRLMASFKGGQPIFLDPSLQTAYETIESHFQIQASARVSDVGMFSIRSTKSTEMTDQTAAEHSPLSNRY